MWRWSHCVDTRTNECQAATDRDTRLTSTVSTAGRPHPPIAATAGPGQVSAWSAEGRAVVLLCERWWRGGCWRRGGTGRSILGLLAGILTVVTVRPVQDCRHCGDTCCCWPALQSAPLQSHQQGRVSSLTHLVGPSGEDKLGRPPLRAPHQLQALALHPQPELKTIINIDGVP